MAGEYGTMKKHKPHQKLWSRSRETPIDLRWKRCQKVCHFFKSKMYGPISKHFFAFHTHRLSIIGMDADISWTKGFILLWGPLKLAPMGLLCDIAVFRIFEEAETSITMLLSISRRGKISQTEKCQPTFKLFSIFPLFPKNRQHRFCWSYRINNKSFQCSTILKTSKRASWYCQVWNSNSICSILCALQNLGSKCWW